MSSNYDILVLEVLRSDGICSLVLFPRTEQELCLSISDQSLGLVIDRLSEMQISDRAYDVMAVDLFKIDLPEDEEPE